MSTTSYPLRLLASKPFLASILSLGLLFGLAGCTSLANSRRARTASNTNSAKTSLAVGEKPLPVVTGEPGSTVSADEDGASEPSTPRTRGDARISGRVYDADGQPVPDAKVRLAVNGSRGGKIVRTSTDASGAFTLHGLRPGSNYTLIAEWEGDDGPMTGRISARAADTSVKISLAPVDAPDTPVRAAAPPRINRVSDRSPFDAAADDEESDPLPGAIDPADASLPEPVDVPSRPAAKPAPRGRLNINEEDLPPAIEAEALDPAASAPRRSRVAARTEGSEPSAAASETWRRRAAEVRAANARKARDTEEFDPDPAPRPAKLPSEPEIAPLDADARGIVVSAPDEQDPLPPALEPGREQAAIEPPPAADPEEQDPLPPAAEPPQLAETEPVAAPEPAASAGLSPFDRLANQEADAPTPLPEATPMPEPAPPPILAAQPTPQPKPEPVVAAPAVAASEPAPTSELPKFEADPFQVQTAEPSPTLAPTPSPAPRLVARNTSLDAAEAAGERPRPTWGEVLARTGSMPPVESGPTIVTLDSQPPASTPTRTAPARQRIHTASTPAAGPIDDPSKPVCEYDDRHRRIVDFRLVDLEGRPVRFRDIDSDLILIDFWGTWCQPCIKSIPHLVELQERMGKRMTVLGIACEADAPEKSAAKVSETARQLKVNYPILLSRNDGTCPLQEALHIQAFPTMVLVDREGRVLWRDQGATPATLARLDRVLATTPNADDVRRY